MDATRALVIESSNVSAACLHASSSMKGRTNFCSLLKVFWALFATLNVSADPAPRGRCTPFAWSSLGRVRAGRTPKSCRYSSSQGAHAIGSVPRAIHVLQLLRYF